MKNPIKELKERIKIRELHKERTKLLARFKELQEDPRIGRYDFHRRNKTDKQASNDPILRVLALEWALQKKGVVTLEDMNELEALRNEFAGSRFRLKKLDEEMSELGAFAETKETLAIIPQWVEIVLASITETEKWEKPLDFAFDSQTLSLKVSHKEGLIEPFTIENKEFFFRIRDTHKKLREARDMNDLETMSSILNNPIYEGVAVGPPVVKALRRGQTVPSREPHEEAASFTPVGKTPKYEWILRYNAKARDFGNWNKL